MHVVLQTLKIEVKPLLGQIFFDQVFLLPKINFVDTVSLFEIKGKIPELKTFHLTIFAKFSLKSLRITPEVCILQIGFDLAFVILSNWTLVDVKK